jgi:hypothetical protein
MAAVSVLAMERHEARLVVTCVEQRELLMVRRDIRRPDVSLSVRRIVPKPKDLIDIAGDGPPRAGMAIPPQAHRVRFIWIGVRRLDAFSQRGIVGRETRSPPLSGVAAQVSIRLAGGTPERARGLT